MAGTQLNRRSAPCRGVTHSNRRHTAHFTVIGNHLAQHAELSLLAIGLAVHIQSLPAGADVSIKRLTSRFPESEARIAAALRELERHGYYHRERVRLPSGALVTRTTSYNQPKGETAPTVVTRVARVTGASRATAVPPQRQPRPQREVRFPPRPQPEPEPEPEPRPREDAYEDAYEDRHEPTPPAPVAPAASAPVVPVTPAVPVAPGSGVGAGAGAESSSPLSLVHARAVRILVSLRHADPRLLLSETEVARLTPAVTQWLLREAGPEAIRTALTTNLPEPMHRPAAVLTHRLRTGLPPLPHPHPRPTPHTTPPLTPLRTTGWTNSCDTCERALPNNAPQCRDCARAGTS